MLEVVILFLLSSVTFFFAHFGEANHFLGKFLYNMSNSNGSTIRWIGLHKRWFFCLQ